MVDNWHVILSQVDLDLEDISDFVDHHRALTSSDVTEINKMLTSLKQSISIMKSLTPEKHDFSGKLLQKQAIRLQTKLDGLSVLTGVSFSRLQWEIISDVGDMRALLVTMK